MRHINWRRRVPVLLGFLISVGTLWALLDGADLSAFSRISSRIRLEYAGLFLIAVFLAHVVNGLRWYSLIGGSLSALLCVTTVAVGVGANQALPARGGEFLRLYLTGQLAPRTETGLLAGRMFVEKILESGTVLGAGLVALFRAGEKLGPRWAERSGLLLAFYVATTFLLYLIIRKRNASLVRAVGWCFARLRSTTIFEERLRANLESLGEGMSISRAAWPLALTLLLWLGPYVLMYFAVGRLLQIDLTYVEVLLLVCASAVGLALPSAPSGVGVLHAALVSAFVVMGRSASEGLLLATAAHMLAVVANGVPAVPLYFVLASRIKRGIASVQGPA